MNTNNNKKKSGYSQALQTVAATAAALVPNNLVRRSAFYFLVLASNLIWPSLGPIAYAVNPPPPVFLPASNLVASTLWTGRGRVDKKAPQSGLAFFVNSSRDDDDLHVGDNLCQTATGECTLRAAIQETNFRASGEDGIFIEVPFVTLTRALPDLVTSIAIVGEGIPRPGIEAPGFFIPILAVTVPSPGEVLLSGLTIGDHIGTGVDNNSSGTLDVTSCTFSSNFSNHEGGGIHNRSDGTVNVSDSDFHDNNAIRFGAAIFNENGTINIDNCSFFNNFADPNSEHTIGGSGGTIANLTGTVTISRSWLRDSIALSWGDALGRGGSIFNDNGTVIVNDSTLEDDLAAEGGAIFNNLGIVKVNNCTLDLNGSPSGCLVGGGIFNAAGFLTVSNSTLSGNIALVAGGLFNQDGTMNVSNSTLIGDTSEDGNGVVNEGTANVKNSILADAVSGLYISFGFNLIRSADGSSGFNASTDQKGTDSSPLDPKLDPSGLRANGGPTLTIALLPGSPAIDKATSMGLDGVLTTDQRGVGFARTINDPAIPNATGGDGTDVGAFEAAIPPPTPTPTPIPTPIPLPPPTAKKATNETGTSFTANWSSVSRATGYRLDVSTSSSFVTYVSGYKDLDVGNVTSRSVTRLTPKTDYFYRVRATNSGGTSGNSNVITARTNDQ